MLQTVLDAAGPESARIARLWWLMLSVGSGGIRCRHRLAALRSLRAPAAGADAGAARAAADRRPSDRAMHTVVAAATVATVFILLVLLVASVWTNRAVASLGASSAVTINLTGHQWWWEAEYRERHAVRAFKTANELHIPVGTAGRLKVTSTDVIHSLWMPNLQGKRDLIPGYTTAIWLQADRRACTAASAPSSAACSTRTWRCTSPPNRMTTFEQWRAGQIKPAVEPDGSEARRGPRRFPARHVHAVPHDSRHDRRARRSGPTSRTSPRADARRRHAAEPARAPGRLDRRSAADQAGRADAAEQRAERRPAAAADIPGDAQMTPSAPTSAPHEQQRDRDRITRCRR